MSDTPARRRKRRPRRSFNISITPEQAALAEKLAHYHDQTVAQIIQDITVAALEGLSGIDEELNRYIGDVFALHEPRRTRTPPGSSARSRLLLPGPPRRIPRRGKAPDTPDL